MPNLQMNKQGVFSRKLFSVSAVNIKNTNKEQVCIYFCYGI